MIHGAKKPAIEVFNDEKGSTKAQYQRIPVVNGVSVNICPVNVYQQWNYEG
tara:strand:- start:56 stop:208 length:153 start_codon:yes stop_codon:yes gene_type:complete